MAASDTSRLEIQNEVFASMTPGEAIEAALAELEEEESEQNQSTHGGEREAEGNDDDGIRLNYQVENNGRACQDTYASAPKIPTDMPRFKLFQPWLLITSLVYLLALVLGGVSVFTDSWARLQNIHIGLFASCNVTTAKNELITISILGLLGFTLLIFGFISVLFGWTFWFLTYLGSMVAFASGLVYFVAILMFAAIDLDSITLLSSKPTQHYSFGLGVVTLVMAWISGGIALQALRWQHKNLDIKGFQLKR